MIVHELAGKRVAILATDGFEQSELFEPKKALEDNGAVVTIVSPHPGQIRAWDKSDWGQAIHVDRVLGDVSADEFDALVLPGGVMNPDKLRIDERAVSFVKSFAETDKPIGAICHAPWLLIEARVVDCKTITSWPSLETDLRNAGATWVDQEVVIDEVLVTSRRPEDLPAFNKRLIETIKNDWHKSSGRISDEKDEFTITLH
jgi:protease I